MSRRIDDAATDALTGYLRTHFKGTSWYPSITGTTAIGRTLTVDTNVTSYDYDPNTGRSLASEVCSGASAYARTVDHGSSSHWFVQVMSRDGTPLVRRHDIRRRC